MATGEEFDRLDVATGKQLLEYTRAIIEATVTSDSEPEAPDIPVLEQPRGVFVTLEKHETLRGCIGRPRPEQPLGEGLRAAAQDAATSDPRFPPLAPEEIDVVTVETSVLTPPIAVGDQAPDAIEVGRDGLIVSNGQRHGLLLPQVASERDWDPERFLAETARKAGLGGDAWTASETTVKRISAQVFAEQSPGGTVTVEDYTRPDRQSAAQSTD